MNQEGGRGWGISIGKDKKELACFSPPPTCRVLERAESEKIRRQESADNFADGLRLCIAADQKKANTLEAVLDFLDVREIGGEGGGSERGKGRGGEGGRERKRPPCSLVMRS